MSDINISLLLAELDKALPKHRVVYRDPALAKQLEAADAATVCAHGMNDGIGTKHVGYALPEMGPFLCINCLHSNREGNRCDHPEVIMDPDVPKTKDGKAAVIKPAACCNEFHPRDVPDANDSED